VEAVVGSRHRGAWYPTGGGAEIGLVNPFERGSRVLKLCATMLGALAHSQIGAGARASKPPLQT